MPIPKFLDANAIEKESERSYRVLIQYGKVGTGTT